MAAARAVDDFLVVRDIPAAVEDFYEEQPVKNLPVLELQFGAQNNAQPKVFQSFSSMITNFVVIF